MSQWVALSLPRGSGDYQYKWHIRESFGHSFPFDVVGKDNQWQPGNILNTSLTYALAVFGVAHLRYAVVAGCHSVFKIRHLT